MGGVLYAALQNELIERFGLEGCLLIIGALALNVVACAGPMRPLTPPNYYLKQRAAILERAAEQHRLQEEEPSNQKTDQSEANNLVVTMESKEPLVRRRSLFRCSAFVNMIKIKMRHYSQ